MPPQETDRRDKSSSNIKLFLPKKKQKQKLREGNPIFPEKGDLLQD